MKKKLLLLVAIVATMVATLLVGCGTKKDVSSKTLLEEIQERGKLVIATEGTWAPWTYHDADGKLVGFDIEVAEKICEKLGVEADFVEVEWDGILAGVDSGRYDIAANGVEIDDDRIEKYDFTDPYAYIHTALIVKNDNEDIKTFKDLDGKTTANTLQSTYAKLAESNGAKVTGVDDLVQTIELLLAGRVDATLNADVSYYDYVKEHPEAEIKIAALTDEASLVSLPVKKGERNKTFIEEVNKAIKELSDEGVLAEISNKYFGGDITTKE